MTSEELQAIRERVNKVNSLAGTNETQLADFTAHAREDVPKLLDDVERLRGAIHNAIERLDWIDGYASDAQEARVSASNLADNLHAALGGDSK